MSDTDSSGAAVVAAAAATAAAAAAAADVDAANLGDQISRKLKKDSRPLASIPPFDEKFRRRRT